MALTTDLTKGSRLIVVAAVFVVIAALYFAQEVLVPLALAVLLAFILGPLVTRLERVKVPRVLSVLIVVSIAMCLCAFLAYTLITQFVQVAERLPAYQSEIRSKLNQIRAPSKLTRTYEDLERAVMPATMPTTTSATQPVKAEVSATQAGGAARRPGDVWPANSPIAVSLTNVTTENPLPVRLYSATTPAKTVLDAFGTAVHPIATAFIVCILVIFMLLSREDLRDRMIRLLGAGQINAATQALSEAGGRTSQYLLSLAAVNLCFGAIVAGGLWLIGQAFGGGEPFPNVLLWGLICGFARFIPYVGTWVGAALPIALSFGLFKGYGAFAATVGMFLTVEVILSQFIEPRLYGSRTGMSTLAVLVSAIFWTWLWGPVGLLLSMPLTVVLLVIGKYVPQLQFLDVILGDEPVLEPPVRLYQRLLAKDSEEAAELSRTYLKDKPLRDVYEEVLLPALAMAEQDHETGQLDDDRHAFIIETMKELVDELGELARERNKKNPEGRRDGKTEGTNGQTLVSEPLRHGRLPKDCIVNVLCVPSHDESDTVAGLMIAQLLLDLGYCVNSISHALLASETVEAVEKRDAHLVVVSALPPAAVTHARYLCKRLATRYPELNMVVGLWTSKTDLKKARDRIAGDHPAQLVTNFSQALDQIQQLVQPMLVATTSSPQLRP